jgi:uncharacterized membrane protein
MTTALFVAPLFEVECGYLLRALSPRFGVHSLRGSWRGFTLNEIGAKFPRAPEGLSPYDGIIFSDVGAKNFNPAAMNAVCDWVHAGGGFLMIGGHASFAGFENMGGWSGTPIEQILPVRISGPSDAIQRHTGFVFEPTGVQHPAIEELDFSDMPVAIGYNRVVAKPDAQILLRCGDDPILCVGKVGCGRVTAFMSDAHPHWSGGWTDWPHYAAFWQQLLLWVCEGK